MKRIYLLLFIGMMHTADLRLFACDQCGCASGGIYSTIMPFATGNFISFRTGWVAYDALNSAEVGHSRFVSMDISGGYSIGKNLHLLGYVPYKMNSYTNSEVDYSTSGLGDAGVVANYIIRTNRDSMMKQWSYALSVKGGIEMPTGIFEDQFRADKLPAAISLGTGSWDYSAGARLIVKRNKITLAGDYTIKYNTVNQHHYQFGTQQNLSLMMAQKIIRKDWALNPYAGISGEFTTADYYYTINQDGTEGSSLFANCGFELGRKQLLAGVSADIPLYSDFGGITKSTLRCSARVVYMFRK